MQRKVLDYLKNPLCNSKISLPTSIVVFVVSIFVNAYFQITSYSALAKWLIETSGSSDVETRLAELIRGAATPIGLQIAFGLLMTIFAIAFLFLAAYWEEKDKNILHLFQRACSTMIVPLSFMLVGSLLMNTTLFAGVLCGVLAAASCMTTIINSGKKANVNGYILIAVTTALFMIAVVMLTRNHLITMLSI